MFQFDKFNSIWTSKHSGLGFRGVGREEKKTWRANYISHEVRVRREEKTKFFFFSHLLFLLLFSIFSHTYILTYCLSKISKIDLTCWNYMSETRLLKFQLECWRVSRKLTKCRIFWHVLTECRRLLDTCWLSVGDCWTRFLGECPCFLGYTSGHGT